MTPNTEGLTDAWAEAGDCQANSSLRPASDTMLLIGVLTEAREDSSVNARRKRRRLRVF